MAIEKKLLSGSTGGRGVKVAATASTGTTIHTTGTSATDLDEVWLFATNNDSSSLSLTIQFGGTTATDDDITLAIPAKTGLTLAVPGLLLAGDGASGRTVRAYASAANKVVLHGYVNRMT